MVIQSKIVVVHDSRADISNNLHTALRKYCDSSPTSIAWNLFHIVSDNTLNWFYEMVEQAVKGKVFDSPAALNRAIKEAIIFDDDWPGKPERAAIHTTLMLFDEDDWGAYTSILYQELPVLADDQLKIE